MRALAASHVQAAQATLPGIRTYTGVIEEAISEGVTLLDRPSAGPPDGSDGNDDDLLLVIGAEHGFVGALNQQLTAETERMLAAGRQLAVVGTRLTDVTREHGLEPVWTEPMSTQTSDVLRLARRVAVRLRDVARAELLFAAYRRGGEHEIVRRRVLPLEPRLLDKATVRAPPLHHLPAGLLLDRLAGEYLLAEVTQAITEAFASENGARLQVMEAADRSIDTRLKKLEVRTHSVRQSAITAELLDVITGARAVTEGDAGERR